MNALKKEVEAMDKKLSELSDDELKFVIGGLRDDLPDRISSTRLTSIRTQSIRIVRDNSFLDF